MYAVHCSLYTGCIYIGLTPLSCLNQVVNSNQMLQHLLVSHSSPIARVQLSAAERSQPSASQPRLFASSSLDTSMLNIYTVSHHLSDCKKEEFLYCSCCSPSSSQRSFSALGNILLQTAPVFATIYCRNMAI